jgi:hypothetical protein
VHEALAPEVALLLREGPEQFCTLKLLSRKLINESIRGIMIVDTFYDWHSSGIPLLKRLCVAEPGGESYKTTVL